MLTFSHTVYSKNRTEPEDAIPLRGRDIKNKDHMMINHDIATVKELFSTSSQIGGLVGNVRKKWVKTTLKMFYN